MSERSCGWSATRPGTRHDSSESQTVEYENQKNRCLHLCESRQFRRFSCFKWVACRLPLDSSSKRSRNNTSGETMRCERPREPCLPERAFRCEETLELEHEAATRGRSTMRRRTTYIIGALLAAA